MTLFWQTLRMFLWLTLLTGICYPLLITSYAYLIMHNKSQGDFLLIDQKAVGAKLIAQKFANDKYFWPRPSANDYNALASGGSNLGPTSLDLKKAVEERKTRLAAAHPGIDPKQFPSELLFASGSGLDPHISPAAARFQIERIAKARNKDKKYLSDLIDTHTTHRQFGFLGYPYVNVLELNLALDQ